MFRKEVDNIGDGADNDPRVPDSTGKDFKSCGRVGEGDRKGKCPAF